MLCAEVLVDTIRLGIVAFMGVGMAAVSAWLHIHDRDGEGWGIVAAITWLVVLISA
jgi:hypothetical protein